jgi:crooked neck
MPPANEKKFWKRYIYLWINYAVFEELIAENNERTHAIFEKIISIVPHETFTFAKLWILYA